MHLESAETEGIRVLDEEAGSRILIDRPGARLQSSRVVERTLRLVVAVPAVPGGPSQAYRVGVGDVVHVGVYKNDDLSGDFSVAPDGTITLPLVGTVPAAGLTDTELADQLRRILERDYLVDPQVAVTVRSYQSQWVYVAGTVPRAVRIPISPGMSLKDVLSEAGVALGPGQTVILTRTGSDGQTLTLESSALESETAPAPHDGDVLNVQDPQYVFTQGEIARPGRLLFTKGMTILQAISLSEGLTSWANKKEVRILRTMNGETVEELVNLKKVEERKSPDVPLHAGDVILVKRKVL
jgi:polysaccharide export outer membrane protein